MVGSTGEFFNKVKAFRQQAKLSQTALADLSGVKRQAIYDIESGKYLPNTGVALKLARHLNCRVEDLFIEVTPQQDTAVTLAEPLPRERGRVTVVKVRDRFLAYPVDGRHAFPNELQPADGVMASHGSGVRFFRSQADIENRILLTGCDPAFSLLAAHVSKADPTFRVDCRFAATHTAADRLARGETHLAGMHLHNPLGQEANVTLAQKKLARTGAHLIGFSIMEEGIMVGRGNPFKVREAADLAQENLRFINREPGAALRLLLDEMLAESKVPETAVTDYDSLAGSHHQGAQMVAYGMADAALGLRPVALAYDLDFVPLAQVRCDLVIPGDLISDPRIQKILDILTSQALRQEITLLPGYCHKQTGTTIASF